MQRNIIDYIRRPDTINDDAIAQLQTLTKEHPYFHAAHYTQAEEHKRYEEAADTTESRTVSLIDNFLEAQSPVTPASHPIDAAQDYIGYLLQQESLQGKDRQEELPLNGGGIVEDFLENEHGRIVLKDEEENEQKEEQPVENNNTQNDENNEILTEIMAGIYIKQGKYENPATFLEISKKKSLLCRPNSILRETNNK